MTLVSDWVSHQPERQPSKVSRIVLVWLAVHTPQARRAEAQLVRSSVIDN
jgi:hypothetical protein